MTFRLILLCARVLTLDWPTRWQAYWQQRAAGYARRSEALWLAHLPLMLAKCPHTPRVFIDAGQPLACLKCSGPDHVRGMHGLRIRTLMWAADICARLGGTQLVDNRAADERGEARLTTAWGLLLAVVLGTLVWIVVIALITAAVKPDSI